MLSVSKLSYAYPLPSGGKIEALKDISFSLQAGDIAGLTGPTGSGKSTLLLLLTGVIKPDAGEIRWNTNEETAHTTGKQRLGLLLQNPDKQLFGLTVEKDVAFSLKHSGLSPKEQESRARAAILRMGLDWDTLRDQPPFALSGGEKRRVALAGVLAGEAPVLLFDEPFAGLDPLARKAFHQTLQELAAEGKAILVVSHSTEDLCACATRILELRDGRLIIDSTPGECYGTQAQPRGFAAQIAALLRTKGMELPEGILTVDSLMEALTKGGSCQ